MKVRFHFDNRSLSRFTYRLLQRAAKLMAEEDDDNAEGDDDASVSEDHSVPPVPLLSSKLNGIDH